MKKVVKFGGSSLASAEQFKKVGAIIQADESRVYVIPSAPGKRFSDDTKVTDMLLHVYQTACEGKDIDDEIKAIKARNIQLHKPAGTEIASAEVILMKENVTDFGRILSNLENGEKDCIDVQLEYYLDKGWVLKDED